MQLFTGAKIINLNLQDPKDKEIYQGVWNRVVQGYSTWFLQYEKHVIL
jgi:hypothetical protein